jgi:hypothetical protein
MRCPPSVQKSPPEINHFLQDVHPNNKLSGDKNEINKSFGGNPEREEKGREKKKGRASSPLLSPTVVTLKAVMR